MLISMDECERRVEAMEAKAAEMLAEVESMFRISHVLGAFSGGNDSIVSTHWAVEAKPDALVMVASTQIALPPSVQHIAAVWNHRWRRAAVAQAALEDNRAVE